MQCLVPNLCNKSPDSNWLKYERTLAHAVDIMTEANHNADALYNIFTEKITLFMSALHVEAISINESANVSFSTEDYARLLYYSVFELITDVSYVLQTILCVNDILQLILLYIHY